MNILNKLKDKYFWMLSFFITVKKPQQKSFNERLTWDNSYQEYEFSPVEKDFNIEIPLLNFYRLRLNPKRVFEVRRVITIKDYKIPPMDFNDIPYEKFKPYKINEVLVIFEDVETRKHHIVDAELFKQLFVLIKTPKLPLDVDHVE